MDIKEMEKQVDGIREIRGRCDETISAYESGDTGKTLMGLLMVGMAFSSLSDSMRADVEERKNGSKENPLRILH